MKFAFMSFSTPGMTLGEMLGTAERYGYHGIEPRLDADHRHGIEVKRDSADRELIRETIRRSSVALACLATSCCFADPKSVARNVADTHTRIDLAGDVGAPCLRVFGGNYPDELSRDQAIDGVAAALSGLADHAAERDVTLCLETHDAWCDPRHVAAIMERAGHRHVAVNWDIMHPVRTGLATIDEAFCVLRPWVRHVHVHDGIFPEGAITMVPIGDGVIDHKRALELLAGYESFDGFVSGEWINYKAPEEHLPQELHTMQRMLKF